MATLSIYKCFIKNEKIMFSLQGEPVSLNYQDQNLKQIGH